MTKETPRAAKVTKLHLDEAERLKAIWAEKADSTQEKFGHTYNIGTQGAVWRFLNGKDPLSLKAARGFAEGLGVDISAFSPRLAREAIEYAKHVTDTAPPLTQLSEPELQLVLLFRELDDERRDQVLALADRLYRGDHNSDAANPPGLVRNHRRQAKQKSRHLVPKG